MPKDNQKQKASKGKHWETAGKQGSCELNWGIPENNVLHPNLGKKASISFCFFFIFGDFVTFFAESQRVRADPCQSDLRGATVAASSWKSNCPISKFGRDAGVVLAFGVGYGHWPFGLWLPQALLLLFPGQQGVFLGKSGSNEHAPTEENWQLREATLAARQFLDLHSLRTSLLVQAWGEPTTS